MKKYATQSYKETIRSQVSTYNDIKSNQIISTILDTIDEKSNPRELKQSLKRFDKQFLTLYNQDKIDTYQQKPKTSIPKYRQSNHHANNFSKINTTRHNNDSFGLLPKKYSSQKLSVPRPNTLTDKFMKQVFGAEEQLISQYDRKVNPKKYLHQTNEQMIKNAKQSFKKQTIGAINLPINYFDEMCNQWSVKPQAFYDEQYYAFLKTNIKYLSQLNDNCSQKLRTGQRSPDQFKGKIKKQFQLQYPQKRELRQTISDNAAFGSQARDYHKHGFTKTNEEMSKIVQKLQQTGGIQNTIGKMEKSLKINELRHLKFNQYLQTNRHPHLNTNKTTSSQYRAQYTTDNQNQLKKSHQFGKETDKIIHIENSNTTIKNTADLKFINYQTTQWPNRDDLRKTTQKSSNWRQKSESMRRNIERSLGR